MSDLSDVAVVVSFGCDSHDRLANLSALAAYYAQAGTGAELVVVEQGPGPAVCRGTLPGLRHVFLEDAGCHWKTRNQNRGALASVRSLLLMSDVDCLPHPDALAAALDAVRTGQADAVHLHDGIVRDLKRTGGDPDAVDWVKAVCAAGHVVPGAAPDAEGAPRYGNADYAAVGGATLLPRSVFAASGGWNENFVSYGFEDQEFDLRLRRLGHRVRHTPGHNLFHLPHRRGADSRFGAFYRENEAEFARVAAMDRPALRGYADRGFRMPVFDRARDWTRTATAAGDGWRATDSARMDLSDLTIAVVADSLVVPYGSSCLQGLLDLLEGGFRDYDVQVCEVKHTGYKYIHNKRHVTHRSFPGPVGPDDLAQVFAEAGRPFTYTVELTRDAPGQLRRVGAVFRQLADGTPRESLFRRLNPVGATP